MKLQIEIKKGSRLGLEVFRVYVNGVHAAEFVSVNGASSYVMTKFPSAQWK
jgi:hypothetical protein